jgi:cyclopropane fatty-acyl-phospholipid synthase-like methyltransferase
MGGRHFRDDAAFVQGGIDDVKRLVEVAGLTDETTLLDWGCGAGRLAVGIREHFGAIALYHGVDVNKAFIVWNDRNLGGVHFKFSHVNTSNRRYNPNGETWTGIPADTGSVDVFYAYSVFSHLRTDDTARYLVEISRLLRPGGRAFVTAFIEDAVPNDEENPADYGPLQWNGPLHCVRYNHAYFDQMITKAGLEISNFHHGEEADGQSLYLLRKPLGCATCQSSSTGA